MIGTVAHLWFALSNDIISMFAARIVAGLSAANIGVIQALLPIIQAGERARMMGFLGAALARFVLGPALGGLLGGIGSGPVHQSFLIAALFPLSRFA